MTREEFFAQKRIDVDGVSDRCAPLKVYKQSITGQIVYELELDAGLPSPVEIGMLTDIHFNYANADDASDPEIVDTLKHRQWLKDGESVPYAINALSGAALLDQLVICGDTLDYLSKGAMELMQKLIFTPYPDAICLLGGHELTKEMQTGKPDRLSLDERLAILEDFWTHDAHYVSRLVGGRVLCIGLDNSTGHYFRGTAERLSCDIDLARRNGYAALIFQHEPVNTANERYRESDTLWVGDPASARWNFFDNEVMVGSSKHDTPEDADVYLLVTKNADVVKGIFAGHLHSLFYNEIKAATADGALCPIPQCVIPSNAYSYKGSCGQITRIIVK